MIVAAILLIALALAVGFAAGARYTRTRLLPVILARMTPGEMSHLAERITAERAQLRAKVPPASAGPPSLR